MLNALWVALVLVALLAGALNDVLGQVAKAVTDSASAAVTLSIGLVGTIALWLGLMRVLQQAGALKVLAAMLRPLLRRLFPEVPDGHPALSMIVLNITSNMLGLGNAATPFGLKAMTELDKLNPNKGTATNAMALLLAINTAGFALVPTNAIAIRAAAGSQAPGAIFLTTLIATTCSTLAAIIVCKLAERLFRRADATALEPVCVTDVSDEALREAQLLIEGAPRTPSAMRLTLACAMAAVLVSAFAYRLFHSSHVVGTHQALRDALSQWPLVIVLGAIVIYGVARGVKIYDCVVEGGKEGFGIALRIIPFLVAMLVAIGMLRASGAMDLLVRGLSPLTSLVGMPAEALPMALLRPFSGSGSLSLMAEMLRTHGPDSFIGNVVSTMYGGTETTFYVLAVYFGSVAIRNARHTLIPCIAADIVGAVSSVWAVRLLLGG